MQKSVTSFSRKGVDDRGDASGWTATPGEEPAAPQVLKYYGNIITYHKYGINMIFFLVVRVGIGQANGR